eukprot:g21075.t1
MVTRNAKGREQVMAADGVRLLVTAMRHSQSWEVQENCCKALKEKSQGGGFLKDDGLQVVLDAMKKHLSVARVQVAACGVLRNTCACSSKYQAHLISLGAGQRVLQGMARHNKDATVQCACCWALQEMARQGALPAVLRAMRLANPKVQEAGCWVLRELATTLTSNVQLWLDVVQAVSTAMRDHAGQEVQKAGLAARQRLALRGFKTGSSGAEIAGLGRCADTIASSAGQAFHRETTPITWPRAFSDSGVGCEVHRAQWTDPLTLAAMAWPAILGQSAMAEATSWDPQRNGFFAPPKMQRQAVRKAGSMLEVVRIGANAFQIGEKNVQVQIRGDQVLAKQGQAFVPLAKAMGSAGSATSRMARTPPRALQGAAGGSVPGGGATPPGARTPRSARAGAPGAAGAGVIPPSSPRSAVAKVQPKAKTAGPSSLLNAMAKAPQRR